MLSRLTLALADIKSLSFLVTHNTPPSLYYYSLRKLSLNRYIHTLIYSYQYSKQQAELFLGDLVITIYLVSAKTRVVIGDEALLFSEE